MGFANHGGMWSDLVLLSMANAAIVPEPATMTLAAAGLAPLVGGLLKRRRRSEVAETEETEVA